MLMFIIDLKGKSRPDLCSAWGICKDNIRIFKLDFDWDQLTLESIIYF